MLAQAFLISLYAIALAGLSALLVWLLPEAYLTGLPAVRRWIGRIDLGLDRTPKARKRAPDPDERLWPRISGPA